MWSASSLEAPVWSTGAFFLGYPVYAVDGRESGAYIVQGDFEAE
jgi:hypothetical protein